ncbi:hypothetical protein E2C01_098953 [Portunus trituberculatus]|uniref:Uncharacterized protein n=1 Tax=Portunus trituberculatus TaxID=210409 RepID=A0A5B7K2J8_PORTR|nr:hypothetical protein [Portunus trituberculatus]
MVAIRVAPSGMSPQLPALEAEGKKTEVSGRTNLGVGRPRTRR